MFSPSDASQLWAIQQAINVWHRLEFTRATNGVKINETTITQNLIYEFWIAAEKHKLPFWIYEADDEETNGNDIEILLETEYGYLKMAVQAKLIKYNDKYSAITHRVKRSSQKQIDLLIKYAQRNYGIPLYFFYNFSEEDDVIQEIKTKKLIDIEHFGISFANASRIKEKYFNTAKNRWKIPTFRDIHLSIGYPFHELFADDPFSIDFADLKADPFLKESFIKSGIKFFTEQELHRDDKWNLISIQAAISGALMFEETIQIYKLKPKLKIYNPKFRIIISPEREKSGGLYHIS